MAFCPNCGKQLADGAKFCSGCGNPVAPAVPVQPVAQPAPVQSAPVQPVAQPAPVNPVPVQPAAQPTPVNPAPAQPVYAQSAPVQGTPVPVAVKKSKINWTVLIILLLVGVLIIGAGVAVIVDLVDDGEFNLFGLLDSDSDSDDDDDDDDDKKGDSGKKDPEGTNATGAIDETRPADTTAPAETEPDEPDYPTTAVSDIVGRWEADMDLSAAMNNALEYSMGAEYLEYLYVDEFEVGVTMEFEADGEYSMSFNERDFERAMENLIPEWTDGFADMIIDMGMSVEDFEAQIGTSLEEYIELSFASGFDASSFETDGDYELDGDELCMDNADGRFVIDLNGDRMEFVDYTGDDDEGMFELMFADVTFRRQ